jgi:hypothetical protein
MNEFTLLGPKIEDNKIENIIFILDLNEEILNYEFQTNNKYNFLN